VNKVKSILQKFSLPTIKKTDYKNYIKDTTRQISDLPLLDLYNELTVASTSKFAFPRANNVSRYNKTDGLKSISPFKVNVYGGYSFIQRRLTTNYPQDLSEIIALRNKTESLLEAVSIGTDLRYKTKSGFYAKVGLEYLSINERFNWSSQDFKEELVEDVVVYSYVSSVGDTTNTTGNVSGFRSIDKTWVNYNNHKMLSLPLSFGYTSKNRGPWSFFAEGSFHLNVFYNFSGKVLNIVMLFLWELLISPILI